MLLCYDYYHVVPVEVGSYFACNFCVKIFLERSVPRTKNPIFGNSMSSLWLNDTKVVQLGVKLRAGKYFSEFTIARLSLCLSTWNIKRWPLSQRTDYWEVTLGCFPRSLWLGHLYAKIHIIIWLELVDQSSKFFFMHRDIHVGNYMYEFNSDRLV